MIISITSLFILTLAGGLASLFFSKPAGASYKLALIFAGSYLFSITIIHILPEIMQSSTDGKHIGMLVLAGFLMQHFLEFFTTGVEHGHSHDHSPDNQSGLAPYSITIALCVHAFLEGTVLAHPGVIHGEHEPWTLLVGILLHKIPAAFALMSVLGYFMGKSKKAILLLVLFAIASPLGLIVSNILKDQLILSESGSVALFAIVSGNFLHISTTIFFESSPKHHHGWKKNLTIIIGGIVAMISEALM
jgi:zinc and cadmium transporter